MYVVGSEQMIAIENQMFSNGMPIAALMEKAAVACATFIMQQYKKTTGTKIGILAGPGHNGGDALVIARELKLKGFAVKVWSPFTTHKPLTLSHLQYFQSIGGCVVDSLEGLKHSNLIIDGLLGFGLKQTPHDIFLQAINWLNLQPKKTVISIDVPSGIHSDFGPILGSTVKANVTLTLGLPKLGLFCDVSKNFCGNIKIIDTGIRNKYVNNYFPSNNFVRLINKSLIKTIIPLPRALNAHKYSAGFLYVIAGSEKYLGAAILAIAGAQASGVGYVSADIPLSLRPLWPFPNTVFKDNLLDNIRSDASIKKPQALVCGPGLEKNLEQITELINQKSIAIVLDASALSFLAKKHPKFKALGTVILTPHEGEFAALFPHILPSTSKVQAAQQAACESNCVVVYKGAHTVIAAPNGETYINPRASEALARAGTGDVLAGLIGGLVAQGLPAMQASILAVWLHSMASLVLFKKYGLGAGEPLRLAKYIERALGALQHE